MKNKYTRYLVLVAVLLVAGVALFAAACGGADEASVTTVAATDTTAADAETTGTVSNGGVEVKGLVDDPVTLTVEGLEAMTLAEITVEHPKLGMTDYRGVRFSELLPALGVQEAATAVTMTASDGYMVELPLADLEGSADAMLAIEDDGTLTVVIPGVASKNWVKDVVTLEFK
jgi:hypothetical protein